MTRGELNHPKKYLIIEVLSDLTVLFVNILKDLQVFKTKILSVIVVVLILFKVLLLKKLGNFILPLKRTQFIFIRCFLEIILFFFFTLLIIIIFVIFNSLLVFLCSFLDLLLEIISYFVFLLFISKSESYIPLIEEYFQIVKFFRNRKIEGNDMLYSDYHYWKFSLLSILYVVLENGNFLSFFEINKVILFLFQLFLSKVVNIIWFVIIIYSLNILNDNHMIFVFIVYVCFTFGH